MFDARSIWFDGVRLRPIVRQTYVARSMTFDDIESDEGTKVQFEVTGVRTCYRSSAEVSVGIGTSRWPKSRIDTDRYREITEVIRRMSKARGYRSMCIEGCRRHEGVYRRHDVRGRYTIPLLRPKSTLAAIRRSKIFEVPWALSKHGRHEVPRLYDWVI